MDITDRVLAAMKEKKITQVSLSEATGISKSTLNYILTKHKSFEADHIVAIADKLGVSLIWLLTGNDSECSNDSPSLPEDENELINIYRSLDREGKTMTLATAYQYRSKVKAGNQLSIPEK